jgi:hypothetical protein
MSKKEKTASQLIREVEKEIEKDKKIDWEKLKNKVYRN